MTITHHGYERGRVEVKGKCTGRRPRVAMHDIQPGTPDQHAYLE